MSGPARVVGSGDLGKSGAHTTRILPDHRPSGTETGGQRRSSMRSTVVVPTSRSAGHLQTDSRGRNPRLDTALA